MRCSNCNSEVAPGRFCTRCGAALPSETAAAGAAPPTGPAGAPSLPDVGAAYAGLLPRERPERVPLSGWQQARLAWRCVPFVFLLLATIVMATIFPRFVSMPPVFFFLFMGLVLLVTGYQALQNVRDMLLGVALVREDVLQRSRRSSGSGKAQYYGYFEGMGRMRLKPSVHFQSQQGKRYYVYYSPATRYVWALETADEFMAFLEQRRA